MFARTRPKGHSGDPIESLRLIGVDRAPVLTGVDLELTGGDFLVIQGASGAGKSTLLSLLGLLNRPSAGQILLNGKSVEQVSDGVLSRFRLWEIGFVFQEFHLLPRHSALDNVAWPLHLKGYKVVEARQRAHQALERVGLATHVDAPVQRLSGGERQRVAFARAMVGGPSLLIADEPTGNLDEASAGVLEEVLEELHGGQVVIVVATHDPRLATMGNRQTFLQEGRLCG